MNCKICGREVPLNKGVLCIDGENIKFICYECNKLLYTCSTCVHCAHCNFNDNPAPIPQVITRRSRQQTSMGYVESIQQIPNPQRIKAMCLEEKCICCDHEEKSHCMRQFGVCKNYKEIG